MNKEHHGNPFDFKEDLDLNFSDIYPSDNKEPKQIEEQRTILENFISLYDVELASKVILEAVKEGKKIYILGFDFCFI
jgi:hypothetical protein